MAASQSPPRRSRELGAPLLSAPPEKSSQSLLSPWPPAALRAHPACDRAFLSLAPGPGWSLQTQQIPVVCSHAAPPGKEGESPRICRLLGPCWRSSGPTVRRITVYGNPELRAHSSAPALQPAFPAPIPGSSATLSHPQSFCGPEGPETTLSQRGFHPPLSHPQRSRLLKVPILCSTALSLASSG